MIESRVLSEGRKQIIQMSRKMGRSLCRRRGLRQWGTGEASVDRAVGSLKGTFPRKVCGAEPHLAPGYSVGRWPSQGETFLGHKPKCGAELLPAVVTASLQGFCLLVRLFCPMAAPSSLWGAENGGWRPVLKEPHRTEKQIRGET